MGKNNKLVKICLAFFLANLICMIMVHLFGAKIATISLKSNNSSEIQLFYGDKVIKEFNELNSTKIQYKPKTELTKIRSIIFMKNIVNFRIDFGSIPSNCEVGYVSITDGLFSKKIWNKDDLIKDFNNNNQIKIYKINNNNNLQFETLGNDGYIGGKNINGEIKVNAKTIFLEMLIFLFLIIFVNIMNIKMYCSKIVKIKTIQNIKINIIESKDEIFLEFSKLIKYISKNKYIIYVTIFFTVLTHGVSLFYFKIGIDSEKAIVNYNPRGWIEQGRFGIPLIKKIFSTETITVPAYNILLGLTMLVLFSILSIYIINKYTEIHSKLANIVFLIIFITFSQIPTYMTFVMYSFEVSMAYFIVALSILFISKAILEKHNVWDFVLGIILLIIAISIYQSFISLYVSFVCIICFVSSNKNKDIISEIINVGKFIVVLVIAAITYFFINFILTGSIMNGDGYLGNFIGWKNNAIPKVIIEIIHSIGGVITGKNLYGAEILKIYYIIMPLILITLLFKSKKIIKAIYLIGFAISPFLFNIVLGSAQPVRSLMALPFFVGMFSYILILIFKNRNIQKLAFIGLVLIGMYQAQATSKLYFGDYMRYEQDIQLGNSIAEKVEKLDLGEIPQYPIVYVGQHSLQENNLIIHNEVIGYSFFEWDQGNITRINYFMNILGHNYLVPSNDEVKKAYSISKNMPQWPSSGSVKFEGNVIVVKLSEPTVIWKQRYEIE